MKYPNVHQGSKRTRDTHRRLSNEKKDAVAERERRTHTAFIQAARGNSQGKGNTHTHTHTHTERSSRQQEETAREGGTHTHSVHPGSKS